MKQLFTQEDAWHGGFFEIVFELPQMPEIGIKNFLAQLWSHPALEGCFLRSDVEPINQQRISQLTSELEGHYYGVATLPNTKQTVCGSYWSIYEEDGCWIRFYLPLGSLGSTYPIGAYPFNLPTAPSPERWIQEISAWLQDIATSVYAQTAFKSAIIGFEVDFFQVRETLKDGIPQERWDGLLVPMKDTLLWYPPTIYQAPYTMEKRLL